MHGTHSSHARNSHEELEQTEKSSEENLLVLEAVELVDEGARHRLEHSDLQQSSSALECYNKKHENYTQQGWPKYSPFSVLVPKRSLA